MKTRRLPGSDLDLSVIGLGCWAIGGMWWGDDVDDDTSAATIRTALDLGINWFDTAPLYGHGHADRVLRDALPADRDNLVIATKVGVRWQAGQDHAQSDLSPSHLKSDTEASLARLGVEAIDLLQVHWPCEVGHPLEETLGVLEDLRAQGKVRWYGLCNYEHEELALAASWPGMVSLQTPYSLLRREWEGSLSSVCNDAAAPLGMLAYEPLCRGLLTGKFKVPPTFPDSDLRSWDERFQGDRFAHASRLIADLERAAQRLGVPMAALALGWVCAQPGVTAAIAGAKRPEQVVENVRAASLVDRAKVWRVVDRISAIHGGWPA